MDQKIYMKEHMDLLVTLAEKKDMMNGKLMINKPPLHEMMKNLYFLCKRGCLEYEKMERILISEYEVTNINFDGKGMICHQDNNEIKAITTIWI